MMEDYRQEVCDLAQQILGELTADQLSNLNAVADAVCLYVNARLKKGISNTSCKENYILACALYCVELLNGLRSGELSSFTAGTVSLSFGQSGSQLGQKAEQLLAPWLSPETAFCGVRA